MALTNAEKQAAHRERMKERGYKLVQLWVKREHVDTVTGYAERLEKRYLYTPRFDKGE